ncbi:MAG: hypothetical protein Q9170_001120 [Blastenia crenularia]
MQMQPRGDCTEQVLANILTCYLRLSELPSLHPSSYVLMDPRIVEITIPLRRICSDGEYQLEAYWTKKLLRKEGQIKANAALLTFTYYENYLDLLRMEMSAMASVIKGARPKKYAVLGSGPLPMTSICILQSLRKDGEAINVHNFDRDPWAIAKSSELCGKLGYSTKQIEFQNVDVHDQGYDLRNFDVVYLASLVGITEEEKQDAISEIVKNMSPGALLVLRSAHSLRSLLYPVRCQFRHAFYHVFVR